MNERDVFRKTERLLHNYRHNLSQLEVLVSKLADIESRGDIHAQDYTGRLKSGAGDADPVSCHVQRILDIEHRISVLERYTVPITMLHADLRRSPDGMNRHYIIILEGFYMEGLPLTRLLEQTRWSRNTFYSRRFYLVGLAAEYLGFKAD